MEMTSMDMVLATLLAFTSLGVFSCLFCLCMKYNDWKLKSYILETAKQRGIKVDLEQLNASQTCPSPLANQNCTIMIPDVGIIL